MRKLAGILGMGVLAATLAPLTPQANAQANDSQQQIICGTTYLHYTERGLVFECVDPKRSSSLAFLVRPGNGYDRISEVISAIREHNTRNVASGRTRTSKGLWVRYRDAGPQERAICEQIWRQATSAGECHVAISVGFR